MGVYRQQILPRLQDKIMNRSDAAEVRARVCRGLRGEVVEIGFGTGLNVAHYPPEVTMVATIEPSSVCMRLAVAHVARSPVPIRLAGLDGERLELPSEGFDAVLSTWTLCTIPISQLRSPRCGVCCDRRVPCTLSSTVSRPTPPSARWQRRIEPVNKRVFGGCHLTRRIPAEIEQAGFAVEVLDAYYSVGESKVFGYTFEGRAVRS